MATHTTVTIEGRELQLSNLDKVLYPETGFTKGQVIDYYVKMAPTLLPHLNDRALTLKRYPEGVRRAFFYEKRCPLFRPSWVKTAPIWSKKNNSQIRYCLVNDLPSLVWAANLADLELHTSLALYQHPERPTALVFDLDPGSGAGLRECCEVALWLHRKLAGYKLECFVKTSGSKGLQVYVPLNTPTTFDQSKQFAHTLANQLTAEHPDKVLAEMQKKLRQNKVFIDWVQNDQHKTTVCAYSLRGKEHPTVSMPLRWSEVKQGLNNGKAASLSFEAEQAVKRVAKVGDLFAPVLKLKQQLPALP